jgi:hypothetical protein
MIPGHFGRFQSLLSLSEQLVAVEVADKLARALKSTSAFDEVSHALRNA